MKTRKVMYYEIEHEDYNEWGLTTNTDEESIKNMKLYEGAINFRIATKQDCFDWVCASGEIFEGLLELEDGYYQWQYAGNRNGYGGIEVYGEYKKVGSRKALIA